MSDDVHNISDSTNFQYLTVTEYNLEVCSSYNFSKHDIACRFTVRTFTSDVPLSDSCHALIRFNNKLWDTSGMLRQKKLRL